MNEFDARIIHSRCRYKKIVVNHLGKREMTLKKALNALDIVFKFTDIPEERYLSLAEQLKERFERTHEIVVPQKVCNS